MLDLPQPGDPTIILDAIHELPQLEMKPDNSAVRLKDTRSGRDTENSHETYRGTSRAKNSLRKTMRYLWCIPLEIRGFNSLKKQMKFHAS